MKQSTFLLKIIGCIGLTLIMATSGLSQDYAKRVDRFPVKEKKIDEAGWKKTIKGLNYAGQEADKNKKEGEAVEKEGRRSNNQGSSRFSGPIFTGQNAKIFQILFFIVAFALLTFIIWRLLRSNALIKNPNVKKRVTTIEEAAENIHESDLERFLREALGNNNFKLATRIYYLILLRELAEKKYIHWKKDKTNNEYLSEMKQQPNFEVFREVTLLFERVWYGDKNLDSRGFQEVQPKFDQFIQTIKN